jgi:uncharacterized protein HemX
MDWQGTATMVTSILAAAGALYAVFRKTQREDTREDREETREDDETALAQMQRVARQREKAHSEDIARIERRHSEDVTRLEASITLKDNAVATLTQRERDCQILQAESKVEIAHNKEEIGELKAELAELKAELRRRGGISPAGPEMRTPKPGDSKQG